MGGFMMGLGFAVTWGWIILAVVVAKQHKASKAHAEQARQWLRQSQRENELFRGAIVETEHGDHSHVTFLMNETIIGRMVGAPLFVEAVARIVHERELVTSHEKTPCPEEGA